MGKLFSRHIAQLFAGFHRFLEGYYIRFITDKVRVGKIGSTFKSLYYQGLTQLFRPKNL